MRNFIREMLKGKEVAEPDLRPTQPIPEQHGAGEVYAGALRGQRVALPIAVNIPEYRDMTELRLRNTNTTIRDYEARQYRMQRDENMAGTPTMREPTWAQPTVTLQHAVIDEAAGINWVDARVLPQAMYRGDPPVIRSVPPTMEQFTALLTTIEELKADNQYLKDMFEKKFEDKDKV